MKKYAVSCLPVSLFQDFFSGKLSFVEWTQFAADIGLDAVDINRKCLGHMTLNQAELIRPCTALPLLMMTTYSNFTDPSEIGRDIALDDARKDIALAGVLGARYVRLTAGQYYPDQDEETAIRYIRHGYERCLRAAEDAGVELLIENHSKPEAWRYDDFDFHLGRMARLWEALKDLPVYVNFDTANAYALNGWQELLKLFGDRIRTVHLNDLSNIDPLRFACVGEGIVPQHDILRTIYEQGFNGPVCIEEAGMDGRTGMQRAVKNTKEILAGLTC